MGRHGWIAHTIARLVDLVRFRVARAVASVPGRLSPGSGRSPARGSLMAATDTRRGDAADPPGTESDLPAEFPGAERFEAPVPVDRPESSPGMDGALAEGGDGEVEAGSVGSGEGGWSDDDEMLTFTPDAALDLVDEIEFSFEPASSLGEQASENGRDPGADGIAATGAFDDLGTGWVEGDGTRECPEGFPIKGNGNSHIYHLPGQGSYAATIPELCFATEEAAAAEGYRPVKRSQGAAQ